MIYKFMMLKLGVGIWNSKVFINHAYNKIYENILWL